MKKQKYVYIVLQSSTTTPGYKWNLSLIWRTFSSKIKAEEQTLKHIEFLVNEMGYKIISDEEHKILFCRNILIEKDGYQTLYSINKSKINQFINY